MTPDPDFTTLAAAHFADAVADVAATVRRARAGGQRLAIRGAGTHAALLPGCDGGVEPLSIAGRAGLDGILDYQPTELVLCAGAATPLATVEAALAAAGQMLPFEPPRFGAGATLGGMVATGLSGPRRPWGGAVRDAVLGVQMVNGLGEAVRFGGAVVKNVAGFDLARLQAGAFGRFGVLTAVNLRVLPRPAVERTLAFEVDAGEALRRCVAWGRQPLPVSATCWQGGRLAVRLSGSAAAVDEAAREIGGEPAVGFDWAAVRDLRAQCLDPAGTWRLLVPVTAPQPELAGRWIIEWGGALRWWSGDAPPAAVHAAARAAGGRARPHANLAAAAAVDDPVRHALLARLAAAFDPDGVFAGQPGEAGAFGDLQPAARPSGTAPHDAAPPHDTASPHDAASPPDAAPARDPRHPQDVPHPRGPASRGPR